MRYNLAHMNTYEYKETKMLRLCVIAIHRASLNMRDGIIHESV
jgi:hypothetical protein